MICNCTVPDELHNTCCGWDNANTIVFEGEIYMPAKMDAEEKEIRYLISKSPNSKKLIDWWINRKQQFLVLNTIADTLRD